ncbi:MAG: sialate O-acetylesterase [Rhizomicrobium sp.]
MSKCGQIARAALLALGLSGCSPSQLSDFLATANTTPQDKMKPEPTFPPKPLTLLYTTFQDHAVLQRDKPIPVWGLSGPGANIDVSLAGETASATADANGKWIATLAPLKTGGPYQLTATSSTGKTQTVKDILIGDVFLCSGQSNMEMPVYAAPNYDSDINDANNRNIRLFHVQRFASPTRRETFGADASWAVTSPTTVRDFSSTCYNFGKHLQPVMNLPIGLIEDSWGGSVIQTWISADKMRALGGQDQYLNVLPIYAKSSKDGEKKWREIAHSWWLQHDPASAATPPWYDPAYDDSAWDSIVPTGTWREWPVPLLKKFNGVVWLRETLDLSADQAKKSAVLSLGKTDQADITWVNGVEVGAYEGYDVERIYDVPAGTLHEGRNVIAVGVYGGAGMLTPAEKLTLKLGDGSVIPLKTPWHYKTSATMSQAGKIPHVPWLNQFGLTVLRNGMIDPLGPTPVRGIVWYQGESDAGQPEEYRRLLPAMIDDWRKAFGSDTPFIIVQLPNYGPLTTKPGKSDWAQFREVQRNVADQTPNAALAVTIDLGQVDNIHPTNKQELGRRLALVAERLVYGMNVVDSGPTPVAATRDQNTVAVSFAHVAQGLLVTEAKRPVGFQVCDKAWNCSFVDAVQNKDEIDLDLSGVSDAVTVRYCWADSPLCNVYNSEGLPAVPFEMAIAQSQPTQVGKQLVRKSHRGARTHKPKV